MRPSRPMSSSSRQTETAPFLDRSSLIQWGVLAITLVVVILPIAPVLYQAFLDRPLYDSNARITLDNFTTLAETPRFATVLLNTAYFAVLTTVIAQLVGAVSAILIGRTDVPGRTVFGELLLWPLFISHLVLAFGWFTMYGPSGYITLFIRGLPGVEPWNLYTVTGMGVVAGLSQAPLAYLYCIVSTRTADPALEDAARTVGASPWHVLRHVTLPLMRPALI